MAFQSKPGILAHSKHANVLSAVLNSLPESAAACSSFTLLAPQTYNGWSHVVMVMSILAFESSEKTWWTTNSFSL